MLTFQHILITRFNLKRGKSLNLSDDWYQSRFEIFEQFCRPSVLGQSNPNFRWLLLFDSDTPEIYCSRITAYGQDNRVDILYLDGFDRNAITEKLGSYLTAETHLITTTLNNDDAIAKTFVEQIQSRFTGQQFELLNFLNGYRYDLTKEALCDCRLVGNPFISLIEQLGKDGKFLSIANCLPHSTIPQRFPDITNIAGVPAWLQLVHERNLEVTKTWGRKRIARSQLTAQFSLHYVPQKRNESAISLSLQNGKASAERTILNTLFEEKKFKVRQLLRKRKARK